MDIRDVAATLAAHAAAVCRHYLPNGHRSGRYWIVGDLAGSPGRSLFVNLSSGRWTDAATGEHGDVLDLIRARAGCADLAGAMREARASRHARGGAISPAGKRPERRRALGGSAQLWDLCKPLGGTLAEIYLARRGLTRRVGLRGPALTTPLPLPRG